MYPFFKTSTEKQVWNKGKLGAMNNEDANTNQAKTFVNSVSPARSI